MKTKIERLRAALTARKWDIEYCKFITEIYICAGLSEDDACRVVREVFNLKES